MLATARLERFAVVTFDADPEALRQLLPPRVEVDLPLVSAVAYRYVGLGLRGVPRPRLSGDQVHLRAYVRVGDERGVWFLRTVQDSPFATLPRRLWGMPWTRGRVRIDAPAPDEVRVRAVGVELDVNPAPKHADGGAGDDEDDDDGHPLRAAADGIALEVDEPAAGAAAPDPRVASATVGWFAGRRGVRRFSVDFDDGVVAGFPGACRVGHFEALGLVRPGQPPQSAFRHPDTDITVHLPPRPAFSRQ